MGIGSIAERRVELPDVILEIALKNHDIFFVFFANLKFLP
jgi:hypothetical protein